MHTLKEIMLVTTAGLVLVGAGVAHSAKPGDNEQTIRASQAIEIALAAVPGHIHELELEQEDDILAWEVELVSSQDDKEYEILINASSGEVIEVEMEDDDDWSLFGGKN